jgi:hypothetical protein
MGMGGRCEDCADLFITDCIAKPGVAAVTCSTRGDQEGCSDLSAGHDISCTWGDASAA